MVVASGGDTTLATGILASGYLRPICSGPYVVSTERAPLYKLKIAIFPFPAGIIKKPPEPLYS